ncbi:MAG: hypothetical protein HY698_07315 [Deltaproteobacteria bacterium]|nr:hypothetical protein [Deltaproteobacteria bacterium]
MRRFIASALLVVGCAGKVPHPTSTQVGRARARWPDTTKESLENGRVLLIARCSGCHELYPPAAYPATEWPELVVDMTKRSKLSAAEAEALVRYLVSVTEPAAPAP